MEKKTSLILMSENLTKLLLIIISATVSVSGFFLKNELGRLVSSTEKLQNTMGNLQIQLEGISRDNIQNARTLDRVQTTLEKHEERIKILEIENAKRRK